MKKMLKPFIVIGIVVMLLALVIRYLPGYVDIMKPAPAGIHGTYSLIDYDPVYRTRIEKDSLLYDLEKEGLVVKNGRLHHYDPPWDSTRYLVDSILCDTQYIESYVEFRKEKQDGFTTFRVLWINATPTDSYDTTVYRTLA